MKSNINLRLALQPQPLRRVGVSIQFLFSLYNQKVQVKLELRKGKPLGLPHFHMKNAWKSVLVQVHINQQLYLPEGLKWSSDQSQLGPTERYWLTVSRLIITFSHGKQDKEDGKPWVTPTKRKTTRKRKLTSWLVPLLSNMFDVVKSPWMRPPSCNFPIASPTCKAISSNRSSTTPCDPNSRNTSFTGGPSTNSNVRVCSTGSTEYSTGVVTPSRLAFVVHLASCFNN